MAAKSCPDMRCKRSLAKRMQYLLDTEEGSDVTFVVGETPNVMSVPAHKAILSACSDVFNSMFFGLLKMEESDIELPDIDPNAFKIMLRYIYTDAISLQSINEALLVLYAANKYLLAPLSTKCRDYLMENLSASNVFSVFKFVEPKQGEEYLLKGCIQVICHDTTDLLKDPSFQSIPSSMLDVILEQDNLSVTSETDIWKAVLTWTEAECKRRQMVLPANHNHKRIIIDFALRKIRLLSLSPLEFVNNTDFNDILTTEECYTILTNLVQPNKRPMPPGFCTNSRKRTAPCTSLCPICGNALKSGKSNVPNVANSGSRVSNSTSDWSGSSFGSVHSLGKRGLLSQPVKTEIKLHCLKCGYHSV